jgi:hypothetical protein
VKPEARVKDQVKRILRKFLPAIYWHMPVQNGMGEPTLDFTGCINGLCFAIETKAPGKKPTPRQLLTMADMQAGGAFVFVVSDARGLAVLEATLQLLAA